jgi:photosystem II stability/assembly factor-like uncharacterized protein
MIRKIFVGTSKGMFTFSKTDRWTTSVRFEGQGVFAIGKSRDRIWASPFTEWTGTSLSYSDDMGETWGTVEKPLRFPDDKETSLAKIWQIASDGNGRLFFGVEPSALFTSDDQGKTFEICEGLWNHPHRAEWTPGFGGLCLHTILLLSKDNWLIGASTGGAYRTEDGGETWEACNQKIKTPFLPEETPEFGQCVHKAAFHKSNPDQLFLQHHWGVYRSTNAGKTWENISEGRNLPSDFGFACVSNNPDTAFIIPIKADEFRVFPEGKLRVYRTEDAGETWHGLSNGLPQENAYDCVLRDSFSAAGNKELAFGTAGGSLYFSDDNGDSWETGADHLPRITCVRVY